MISPRGLLARALAALLLVPAGCVTQVVHRGPGRPVGDPRLPAPRKRSDTAGLCAAILPLGSVTCDGRSLPLVSPDGTHVATEAGDAPPWAALLAEREAPAPGAPTTGVQIYRVDRATGATHGVAALWEPVLLGRNGDEEGFLVESLREEGSRWIGRVAWSAGPVTWLVTGEDVNAFASLGPGGRLAWSRRSSSADHFDLVVRVSEREGDEWVVSSQGGDWLLPTWSDGGAGLYVLRLEAPRLELRYLAVGKGAAEPVAALAIVDDGARMADAWQVMASQSRMVGVVRPGGENLIFWHPGARRMAVWRPLESAGAAALLATGSIAAAIDASGLVLVTTAEHLLVQRSLDASDRRVLMTGPQVPRPVSDAQWPYVLLEPHGDRIELTAFSIVGLQP